MLSGFLCFFLCIKKKKVNKKKGKNLKVVRRLKTGSYEIRGCGCFEYSKLAGRIKEGEGEFK